MTICSDPNCKKYANFKLPDQKQRFCKDHKTDKMIDFRKSNKCLEEGCFKTASFDVPGGFLKYCNEHKLKGMVDTTHPRCKELKCETFASYNYKDLKPPLYCLKHKELDMINVISKKCDEEDCSRQAVCGIPGNKPNINI